MLRTLLTVFMSLATGLTLALACATEQEPREIWDTPEYDAGYEAGREAGFEAGYEDGYQEGQDEFLSCAERYATDLYYGGDEYYAVPIDELSSCR